MPPMCNVAQLVHVGKGYSELCLKNVASGTFRASIMGWYIEASPQAIRRDRTFMSSTPSGPKATASIPTPHSKRGWKGFWAEVSREMKKVNWPTRPETNRLTGVVFAVCFIVSLILFALSYIFDIFVKLVTRGSV